MTAATLLDAASTAILTVGLHSAVASLIALAAGRLLRRPQDRDLVWKAALVAPLMTSAAALFVSDAGRRLSLDVAQMARFSGAFRLPPRAVMVRVVSDPSGTSMIRRVDDPVVSAIAIAVVAVATVCVGLTFIRLAFRRRARARLLDARSETAESLALTCGRRVRLSTADALPSPVAIGAAEVCLPTEVMTEFSREHREALVAHELAHLERRDPAWLFAVEIIGACVAFQPVVRLVTRAFRRDVELICDESAVRATGDAPALIGALAQLAAPFDARAPLRGAATAHDGSPLVARAERIASLPCAFDPDRVQTVALVAAVALVALLFAVPAVSSAARVGEPPSVPGMAGAQVRARLTVMREESVVYRRTTNSELMKIRR